LEPFLPYLMPGGDAFPEEKEAAELAARLAELGARLRDDPRRALDVSDFLLAPAFRGGRLLPVEEVAVARHPSLQVFRSATMATELALEARSFAEQLHNLVEGFRTVTVAEFLITAIDVDREKGLASTDVRYDIVGQGQDAWSQSSNRLSSVLAFFRNTVRLRQVPSLSRGSGRRPSSDRGLMGLPRRIRAEAAAEHEGGLTAPP
jgi:hypothetical protein